MSTFDEGLLDALTIETIRFGASGGIITFYGGAGVGKSTVFAAIAGAKGLPGQPEYPAPFAVAYDAEGSYRHFPGTRVIMPQGEDHLFKTIHRFGESTDPTHRVLVIDTLSQFYLNHVEPAILRRHGAESLASIPYGKGPSETLPFGKRLCDAGDYLASRGKWLALVCHSQVKTLNDPATGSYDRHMPKLPVPLAEIVVERSDVVAYAYRSIVTRKGSDGRSSAVAVGGGAGDRSITVHPTASVVAKTRIVGARDGQLPLVWASLGITV